MRPLDPLGLLGLAFADYLGCVVDPATTEVTLTFEPRSVRLGGWISAAALLAIALASAIAWAPANRRPRNPVHFTA